MRPAHTWQELNYYQHWLAHDRENLIKMASTLWPCRSAPYRGMTRVDEMTRPDIGKYFIDISIQLYILDYVGTGLTKVRKYFKERSDTMAHFRGTVQGNRTEASRLGHKSTGLVTTCNGWHVGVTCKAFVAEDTGEDIIRVFVTGGSNGGRETVLATVAESKTTLHKAQGHTRAQEALAQVLVDSDMPREARARLQQIMSMLNERS